MFLKSALKWDPELGPVLNRSNRDGTEPGWEHCSIHLNAMQLILT